MNGRLKNVMIRPFVPIVTAILNQLSFLAFPALPSQRSSSSRTNRLPTPAGQPSQRQPPSPRLAISNLKPASWVRRTRPGVSSQASLNEVVKFSVSSRIELLAGDETVSRIPVLTADL